MAYIFILSFGGQVQIIAEREAEIFSIKKLSHCETVSYNFILLVVGKIKYVFFVDGVGDWALEPGEACEIEKIMVISGVRKENSIGPWHLFIL